MESTSSVKIDTVDLVIFACLNFRKFLIFGFFMKVRIREFSFFNLSSSRNSRELKPREYYQIYSFPQCFTDDLTNEFPQGRQISGCRRMTGQPKNDRIKEMTDEECFLRAVTKYTMGDGSLF